MTTVKLTGKSNSLILNGRPFLAERLINYEHFKKTSRVNVELQILLQRLERKSRVMSCDLYTHVNAVVLIMVWKNWEWQSLLDGTVAPWRACGCTSYTVMQHKERLHSVIVYPIVCLPLSHISTYIVRNPVQRYATFVAPGRYLKGHLGEVPIENEKNDSSLSQTAICHASNIQQCILQHFLHYRGRRLGK